jgi:acyl-CoA reductase-like NAD-dependent aldehyde dehydrogenase
MDQGFQKLRREISWMRELGWEENPNNPRESSVFYRATVFTDVTDEMAIYREEISRTCGIFSAFRL